MQPESNVTPPGMIVVTGAGRGLGRALAIELTNRGRLVAGLGRSQVDLSETDAACPPGKFIAIVADVSKLADVERAFTILDDHKDSIVALINNAAIYERFDFVDCEPEAFMHAVSVNLGGTVYCTHAAIRRMTKVGQGRIINVATFADLGPAPCSSAYSVSKGAARIFTRALLADIGDRFPGIVVNDWVPGALATRMGPEDGTSPAVSARWGAELVLHHDRRLNGATFDRDVEMPVFRSKKQRLLDFILGTRPPPPFRLDGSA